MTLVAGCTFCEILSGQRPASQVLRTGAALAFLDARPVFKGHVLVVPATTSRRWAICRPPPWPRSSRRCSGWRAAWKPAWGPTAPSSP